MHLLTPREALDLWPLMQIGDLVGAAYLPTDGSASPADVTQALARGARLHGATLIERCGLTGVECRAGRVTGVRSERGPIACEGAGKALAAWIEAGEAPDDLWPVDIRRFGAPHRDPGWVRSRTLELYGKHYTIAWPLEEHRSGRPLRRSPLYDRLAAAGACFGEKLGWERPN